MQRARHLIDFYSQNYVRYLAGRGMNGGAATARALWAHYKLGRYRTVVEAVEAGAEPSHWRSQVALAVSAAACGQPGLMDHAIAALQAGNPLPRLRHELAQSLAAFAPAAALELLTGQPPSVLQAALLEKTGQQQEAIAALECGGGSADGPKAHANAADTLLLRANLLEMGPTETLAALNSYLARFGLEPVTVAPAGAMPCPQTLRSAQPLRHSDGPLVSVIVATYNGAARLEASLRSLLQQTYRAVEIIVIDDCSSDDTTDVVHHLQRQHSGIRYRRLPVNVGAYVAKTLGLELARGPLVTCHDCDDWSHPGKIAAQVKPLLRHRGLVATASRWVRLDDGGRAYARSTYPLLRLNPSSILFRKAEVLAQTGVWDSSRTGADSELLARLKAVFGRRRVQMVAAPLAFGAHRSDSLMTARSTGMDTGAMHPDRLAYWQAWSGWHIAALAAGEMPQMPAVDAARPFLVPAALRNGADTINTCLAWWQRNSDLPPGKPGDRRDPEEAIGPKATDQDSMP